MAYIQPRAWMDKYLERRSVVVRYVNSRSRPSDFSAFNTWTKLVSTFARFPDPDDFTAIPHHLTHHRTDIRIVWTSTTECQAAISAFKQCSFPKIGVVSIRYVDLPKTRSILLQTNLFTILRDVDGKKVEEPVQEQRSADFAKPSLIDYQQELTARSSFLRAATPPSALGLTPTYADVSSSIAVLDSKAPNGGLETNGEKALLSETASESVVAVISSTPTQHIEKVPTVINAASGETRESNEEPPEWLTNIETKEMLSAALDKAELLIKTFFGSSSNRSMGREEAKKALSQLKKEKSEMEQFKKYLDTQTDGDSLSIFEAFFFFKNYE